MKKYVDIYLQGDIDAFLNEYNIPPEVFQHRPNDSFLELRFSESDLSKIKQLTHFVKKRFPTLSIESRYLAQAFDESDRRAAPLLWMTTAASQIERSTNIEPLTIQQLKKRDTIDLVATNSLSGWVALFDELNAKIFHADLISILKQRDWLEGMLIIPAKIEVYNNFVMTDIDGMKIPPAYIDSNWSIVFSNINIGSKIKGDFHLDTYRKENWQGQNFCTSDENLSNIFVSQETYRFFQSTNMVENSKFHPIQLK